MSGFKSDDRTKILKKHMRYSNEKGRFSPVVEENTRIRESMENEPTKCLIEQMAKDVVHQILEYKRHDFEILGIIGADRSPSCGVNTTSIDNKEIEGKGLFIDSLTKSLKEHKFSINVVGIKASNLKDALNKVRKLIESP